VAAGSEATAARVVLLGATGFTGALTARALVRRGLRPVLAGRSREKLQALAGELGGLEVRTADVLRPQTVRALVGRGDVLLTTVGPFARYGRPALEAAVEAGAHYVDSTGEAGFVRTVFDTYGPRAEAAGCALLTAFGYDFVPGNLAAGLALATAGSAATKVATGYFFDDGVVSRPGVRSARMSSGTAATAAGGLLDPAHLLSGGRLVQKPMGRKLRTFVDRGARRPAVLYGSTESLSLPRTFPQLTDVANYLGWFGRASYAALPGSYLMPALELTPIRRRLQKRADSIARVTGKGPSTAARSRQRSVAIAVAWDPADRQLASVRVEGPNGYDLTAELMAWAAEELASGAVGAVGALGPVDAFGLDRLVEGCRSVGLAETQ
jgi:short subunit dehydrogenase-like uncharacterized protein